MGGHHICHDAGGANQLTTCTVIMPYVPATYHQYMSAQMPSFHVPDQGGSPLAVRLSAGEKMFSARSWTHKSHKASRYLEDQSYSNILRRSII